MNKEFEEWLDREIKKRSPVVAVTKEVKEVLADIITKALTDLANIEEMQKALSRLQAMKDTAAQAIIVKEELVEKIKACCGMDAKEFICERKGCGDLYRVLGQVQSMIQFMEPVLS